MNSTLLSTQSVDLRHRILGLDQKVPLLDGHLVPYVNLDNAASTPPPLALFFCLSAGPLAPGRLWEYNTGGQCFLDIRTRSQELIC